MNISHVSDPVYLSGVFAVGYSKGEMVSFILDIMSNTAYQLIPILFNRRVILSAPERTCNCQIPEKALKKLSKLQQTIILARQSHLMRRDVGMPTCVRVAPGAKLEQAQ